MIRRRASTTDIAFLLSALPVGHFRLWPCGRHEEDWQMVPVEAIANGYEVLFTEPDYVAGMGIAVMMKRQGDERVAR
jgi:hypothetical protein